MNNLKLFKNTYKEKENEPDYILKAVPEGGTDMVKIGAAWLRGEDGKDKHFSIALETPYKDRPGYKIVEVKGQVVEGDPLAM